MTLPLLPVFMRSLLSILSNQDSPASLHLIIQEFGCILVLFPVLSWESVSAASIYSAAIFNVPKSISKKTITQIFTGSMCLHFPVSPQVYIQMY